MRDWLDYARGLLAGLLGVGLLGVGLLGATAADAAEPLVRKAWLVSQFGNPHLVVLDLRPAEAYRAGHIPGAVPADYRTTEWGVPGPNGAARALPPVERIAATIGGLGVGDADAVVLVADDFASAARVYWTFKVLGHTEVSILDGGARAWTDALDARPVTRQPAVFTPHYRPEMRAELPEVAGAVNGGGYTLVDARPPEQWKGTAMSPVVRVGGHLPGAVSVDQRQALTPDGRLKSPEALAEIFALVGDKPAIAYCNSGHLGSTDWFVMSEILHRPGTRLYDGSMSEWTADPARPVMR
jgi:thiosulfate/3-mercaptopyruvate sulfurtransferase